MRVLIRRLLGGAAVLALATVAGCSSQPELAQLSGKVMFKGQPVPAGWISFTPEPGRGSVRVCQIRNGVYDTATEAQPGIHPGKYQVKIAGFDGQKVPHWGQGKQIFNPIDAEVVVPTGVTTRDFEVPESAGKNVKILPTADT
jgi:hypothetical protein